MSGAIDPISALVCAIFGILPVPLYLRLLWVIFSDASYRKQQCYQLIGLIGITDIAYVSTGACYRIMAPLLSETELMAFLIQFLFTPLMSTLWQLTIAFNAVLAINRLKIMCNLKISSKFIWFLFGISTLQGLFLYVVYARGLVVSGKDFSYDSFSVYGKIMWCFQEYSALGFIGVTFVIYMGILCALALKRRLFRKEHRSIPKNELKLLCQAVILFVVNALIVISYSETELLPNSPWTSVGLLFSTTFACGWLNPGLLLILNRFLRKAAFRRTKKTPVQAITLVVVKSVIRYGSKHPADPIVLRSLCHCRIRSPSFKAPPVRSSPLENASFFSTT